MRDCFRLRPLSVKRIKELSRDDSTVIALGYVHRVEYHRIACVIRIMCDPNHSTRRSCFQKQMLIACLLKEHLKSHRKNERQSAGREKRFAAEDVEIEIDHTLTALKVVTDRMVQYVQ